MAERYFADSFYFLALLCPRDEAHEQARRITATHAPALVTTDAVLLEVADALRLPADRRRTAGWVQTIWEEPDVSVREVDRHLLMRALDLYAARPDKEWGLTDCISFVVMDDEGIGQALTGDAHFEQAGFRILFERR